MRKRYVFTLATTDFTGQLVGTADAKQKPTTQANTHTRRSSGSVARATRTVADRSSRGASHGPGSARLHCARPRGCRQAYIPVEPTGRARPRIRPWTDPPRTARRAPAPPAAARGLPAGWASLPPPAARSKSKQQNARRRGTGLIRVARQALLLVIVGRGYALPVEANAGRLLPETPANAPTHRGPALRRKQKKPSHITHRNGGSNYGRRVVEQANHRPKGGTYQGRTR